MAVHTRLRKAYAPSRTVTQLTRTGDNMTEGSASTPSRVPLAIAGICLAIGIILPLLVATYAKTDPQLWGIPFFYWYQFLLVIVTVCLTTVAYRLTLRYERARHAIEKREGDL